MAGEYSNWVKAKRGILGPVSGSISNLVIQKNNVVRIKSGLSGKGSKKT